VLTENFKKTVSQYGVQASSFNEWCSKITESEIIEEREWTQFNEPTNEDVEKTIETVSRIKIEYDAIIVDEGQDFRSIWWDLVIATLKDKKKSILYIFYDENQSLLSDRCVYDKIEGPIDLSKNCRNAGEIYKLISSFHRQAPDPEVNLLNVGSVKLCLYSYEKIFSDMNSYLNWFDSIDALDKSILLLGNNKRINDHWLVINKDIYINKDSNWKECVKRIFLKVCHRQEHVIKATGAETYINEKLNELSDEAYPTESDIEIVKSFTKYFLITNAVKKRILEGNRIYRNGLHFYDDNGELKLGRLGPKIWDAEYMLHFQQSDWIKGIPKPRQVVFKPYYEENTSEAVKVYNIGTYKGLEADSVLLLIENKEQMHEEEIYVAISRARLNLLIICEKNIYKYMPHQIQYYFENKNVDLI
jgi:hypothetical protein